MKTYFTRPKSFKRKYFFINGGIQKQKRQLEAIEFLSSFREIKMILNVTLLESL